MKTIRIAGNAVLLALVAVVVFQYIPALVSSNDWLEFGAGIGLVIVGLAFIWARAVEIFNEINKEEK